MTASMEAYKTSKSIREVAHERTDFSEGELDKLLDARKMRGGRTIQYHSGVHSC